MASDTTHNEILARFPGPVTLYPSRRKWLLVLIVCLLFAGIGAAYNGDASDWLGVAFFGLGAIMSGLMLLHGAASLTLDADGFEMTNLFRHTRFLWRDASGFEAQFPPVLRASPIQPPSWNKFVAFDTAKMQNSSWTRVGALMMCRRFGQIDGAMARLGSRSSSSLISKPPRRSVSPCRGRPHGMKSADTFDRIPHFEIPIIHSA